MNRNEVDIAFEMLLEEIETVVHTFNQDGATAFQKGNYDLAKELLQKASDLTAFREKVRGLKREWKNLFSVHARRRRRDRGRLHLAKLKRGLRTPQEKFRVPILEVLVAKGGSAPVDDVLEGLYQRMKNILNQYDRTPLASDKRNSPRWRNTAQWERYVMVREGLLARSSPRGIWEITQKGRNWLEKIEHKKGQS